MFTVRHDGFTDMFCVWDGATNAAVPGDTGLTREQAVSRASQYRADAEMTAQRELRLSGFVAAPRLPELDRTAVRLLGTMAALWPDAEPARHGAACVAALEIVFPDVPTASVCERVAAAMLARDERDALAQHEASGQLARERNDEQFGPAEVREVEPGGRRRYDDDGRPVSVIATCGACGSSWDDAIITSRTPAPSGRCPFEDEHVYPERDDSMDEWDACGRDCDGQRRDFERFDDPERLEDWRAYWGDVL